MISNVVPRFYAAQCMMIWRKKLLIGLAIAAAAAAADDGVCSAFPAAFKRRRQGSHHVDTAIFVRFPLHEGGVSAAQRGVGLGAVAPAGVQGQSPR